MLVLSRKAGEAICIGSDVTITVLEIRGQRVRVGLSAPPNVGIRRHELDEKGTDGRSSESRRARKQNRNLRLQVASR